MKTHPNFTPEQLKQMRWLAHNLSLVSEECTNVSTSLNSPADEETWEQVSRDLHRAIYKVRGLVGELDSELLATERRFMALNISAKIADLESRDPRTRDEAINTDNEIADLRQELVELTER